MTHGQKNINLIEIYIWDSFLSFILANTIYALDYTSKETSVEVTDNEATTQLRVKWKQFHLSLKYIWMLQTNKISLSSGSSSRIKM